MRHKVVEGKHAQLEEGVVRTEAHVGQWEGDENLGEELRVGGISERLGFWWMGWDVGCVGWDGVQTTRVCTSNTQNTSTSILYIKCTKHNAKHNVHTTHTTDHPHSPLSFHTIEKGLTSGSLPSPMVASLHTTAPLSRANTTAVPRCTQGFARHLYRHRTAFAVP